MEEILPRNDHFEQSTTFRKSAWGRTNLFLNKSSSTLFREIRAPASTARQSKVGIFHAHAGNNGSEKPPHCVCWHCCHPYDGDGFRLPRVFDPSERVFHVYGWFCSANCAKAYILEHSTFDRGYQMNIFVRMLREVYDIQESIDEAPPRLSLRMFGGPFDIESFRKQVNVCTIVTPPFVSYCMLIEERYPGVVGGASEERTESLSARGSVRGLKRPTTQQFHSPSSTDLGEPVEAGMYAQFLEEKKKTDVAMDAIDDAGTSGSAPRATKRHTTSDIQNVSKKSGGLGRFAVNNG